MYTNSALTIITVSTLTESDKQQRPTGDVLTTALVGIGKGELPSSKPRSLPEAYSKSHLDRSMILGDTEAPRQGVAVQEKSLKIESGMVQRPILGPATPDDIVSAEGHESRLLSQIRITSTLHLVCSTFKR